MRAPTHTLKAQVIQLISISVLSIIMFVSTMPTIYYWAEGGHVPKTPPYPLTQWVQSWPESIFPKFTYIHRWWHIKFSVVNNATWFSSIDCVFIDNINHVVHVSQCRILCSCFLGWPFAFPGNHHFDSFSITGPHLRWRSVAASPTPKSIRFRTNVWTQSSLCPYTLLFVAYTCSGLDKCCDTDVCCEK